MDHEMLQKLEEKRQSILEKITRLEREHYKVKKELLEQHNNIVDRLLRLAKIERRKK